ncbi:ATP-binding protein [Planobispora takensis]|nr:ATP-binding protein [Planobispora takensis]
MGTPRHHRWDIDTDLPALRERIAELAAEAGLSGHRLMDFVVAANEAVINVREHGGGTGTLELWYDDGCLTVEITDSSGTLQAHDVHRPTPEADSPRGFGLWLMGRLCDEFSISQMVGRSRVRLRMHLTPLPVPGAG